MLCFGEYELFIGWFGESFRGVTVVVISKPSEVGWGLRWVGGFASPLIREVRVGMGHPGFGGWG